MFLSHRTHASNAGAGHADLKTTQIYAKPMDERTRAAVNSLDYGLAADGKRTRSAPAAKAGG